MSPITGSGNEKPVYDVFTSAPFQNVSKLQKFVLNVLVQAVSGVEFRLRSPEVERKYSEAGVL